MKARLLLIILALSLASLACSFALGGTPAPANDNILFQDDFSDPNSGWDRVNEEQGITDYADGAYRILVNVADTDVWANPGLSFSDVSVSVDATKTGGDDDNDFGVVCRYQDNQNFYFFLISSDGYYGIGKMINGEQSYIGIEAMPPSEVIKTGNTTNSLRSTCIGSKLTLYVNDQLVDEQEDSTLTSGDVGLMAGTFSNPGTDILFDNFVVRQP
jgi:hypothetical protein